MPAHDDEFDRMVQGLHMNTPTENVEQSPYGGPVQAPKSGLTKRGKAALAIGATVIAGGSLLTWQNYSSEAATNAVKAQELQYKQDLLELEKLKEINKATTENRKLESTADAARQKQVDACVTADKELVGKRLGATYSSVLADCQNQYAPTSTGSLQEAASTSDAGTDSGTGGGINPSALIGIGAGTALLIGVAANRSKKTNAA